MRRTTGLAHWFTHRNGKLVNSIEKTQINVLHPNVTSTRYRNPYGGSLTSYEQMYRRQPLLLNEGRLF